MSWWEGSYEDVFADNPCFKEILEQNYGSQGLDLHWNDSGTIDVWEIRKLTDFVKLITRVSTKKLNDAIERNRTAILSGFRYAKCRMGYKDDYSGEEMYAYCSSRWGVFSEFSTFNQDEDDWESNGFHVEKPNRETAGFVDARPEDLLKRPELSETMKLILDHLSNEPVDLSRKNIVFVGLYEQYFYDVLQKNSGYSYSDEPWTSREESFNLSGNYSEFDMMDWWLSDYRATVYPDMTEGVKYDYVVVRLDKWAEDCIKIQDIQKAIAEKIPIISEYPLWKALFYKEENENEHELKALEDEREKQKQQEQQLRQRKKEEEAERKARRLERAAEARKAKEEAKEEAKKRRETAKTQKEEARRLAEQQKLEQKEEAIRQKEAKKLEAQCLKDEERQKKEAALEEARASATILYAPGEEPERLHKRIQTLLAKLDEAYPDHIIVNLGRDHKKWGETITELYRALGYADNVSFLEAYGFKMNSDRGGRPTTLDPEAVIEELKRRYPEGTDMKMSELMAANKDLPLKTLSNQATQLLGMGLGKYLKQIGVMK